MILLDRVFCCWPRHIWSRCNQVTPNCSFIYISALHNVTRRISRNTILWNRNVHISVPMWCIMGYGTSAWWYLWDWSLGDWHSSSKHWHVNSSNKTMCHVWPHAIKYWIWLFVVVYLISYNFAPVDNFASESDGSYDKFRASGRSYHTTEHICYY